MINVMTRVYDPVRGQFFQQQQNNEGQSNKSESGNKGSNTPKGSGGDGGKGSGGNSGGGSGGRDKVDTESTELTLKDLLILLHAIYRELRLLYPGTVITFGHVVRHIQSDIHNSRYAQIVNTDVKPGRNHGTWLRPYTRIIEL
jgi:hypothetical protein